VGGGESNGPENVNCRICDKGPSVFDVRHNFTTNAVYELPFGPGKTYLNGGGPLGKIVGGWELSGIGTFHTGHPLTISMNLPGSDNLLLPDGNDQTTQRPDLVSGVPLYVPGGGRLLPGSSVRTPSIDILAFQAPPVDNNGNFIRFGNAPNGIGRALDIWQVDFVLTKESKLTERVAMEFAVEAFNIFNHTQLGDPGTLSLDYTPGNAPVGGGPVTNLADPGSFGIITSNVNGNGTNTGTGLPRQLQFMVRFKF
jgi:hypothetical protein